MLAIWLSQTGCTWQKLVDALSSQAVGEQDVAKKIRRTYCCEGEDKDLTEKFISLKSDNLTPNDLASVLNELYEVKDMWYDLGIQLKIAVHDLGPISFAPDRGLHYMLSHWLSNEALSPHTWHQVVDALSSPAVDRPDIAERIRNKYCSQDRDEDPKSIQPDNSSSKQGIFAEYPDSQLRS